MNKRIVGEYIETLVKRHLIKKGYKFLDKNWTCRYGEIDLIFSLNQKIVFVEVKYRSREVLFPQEILTKKKLNAQIRAILQYLQKNSLDNKVWQLDYALVTNSDQRYLLQYFPQVPLEVE